MPIVRYPPMRDALNETGRPIFFSLCGMLIDLEDLFLFLIMFLFIRMGCRFTSLVGS